MKRFLLILLIFILPLLLFYSAAEYYCRTQTNFSVKKKFLEDHLDSIGVLVLGSSHSQNAINPEYISRPAANLAFGSQPLSIDYFLLEKYIGRMPALKTVCLGVSPHRLYDEFDPANWNGHIYSNLYGINYKIAAPSVKDHVLVLSNMKFFTTIFIDYLNPFAYKYEINRQGFITNDFNDRFAKLAYDSVEINSSYTMHHRFEDAENFKLNVAFLEKTIALCKAHGVELVLLSLPLYESYRSRVPQDAGRQVSELIRTLSATNGVRYFDFSSDTAFHVADFKNDNHLNSEGARKFTLMLDQALLHNNKPADSTGLTARQ